MICLLEDQVEVDRGASHEAGRRGRDDLSLGVGEIAGHPDAGDGRRAGSVRLNAGTDRVLAEHDLGRREAKRLEQLGAGLEARRDHDRVESQMAAVGQPDPSQAGGANLDPLDLAVGDGDAEGAELPALFGFRRRAGVLQQRHVRTELLEQQGLVDGGRAGGQDADALVPDLPAVAVRQCSTSMPHLAASPGTSGSTSRTPVATSSRRAVAVRSLAGAPIRTPNRSPSRARAVTRPASTRPPYRLTSARPAA